MALTPAEKQRRYRERLAAEQLKQAAELARLRKIAAQLQKSEVKKTAGAKKASAAKKKG